VTDFEDTQRKLSFWLTAALLVVVAIAYAPALKNGFIYDDVGLIVHRSAHLQNWSGIGELVNHGFWWGVPEATTKTYLFRPWTTATFGIAAQIGGLTPAVFHLLGCLAHLAIPLLLIVLLRPLTGFLPAFAVAALSGLSPAALSSVGMISAHADVWALLFILLYLILFRSYRLQGGNWRLIAANAAFFMALASKEIAVVAPLLAWLLERTERPANRRKTNWTVYLSLVIPLAVFMLWRQQAIGGATSDRVSVPFAAAMVPYLAEKIVRSVSHILLPFHYALYSEYLWSTPAQRGLAFGLSWLGVISALVLLGYGFVKRKLWAFGGLWFLIIVLPVYLFGQGFAPISDFYVYCGIPGLWLFLYGLLAELAARRQMTVERWNRAAAWAASGIALLFAVLTFVRLPILESEYSLSAHMARREPASIMALTRMSDACVRKGDTVQAVSFAKQAVQINPAVIDAQLLIAKFYLNAGDARSAAASVDALAAYAPQDLECQATVAHFYYVAGHCPEAVQTYRQALTLGSPGPDILYNYGLALQCAGDYPAALAVFKPLAEHKSADVRSVYQFGQCCERVDRLSDAEAAYRRALSMDGTNTAAWESLALVCLKQGKQDEARRAAEKYFGLNPPADQAAALRALLK
jgi:Tfp pilus assembly protein PilF